jgi:hypothetical protein
MRKRGVMRRGENHVRGRTKRTLVVEAINAIDGCALMVSTQDEEILRVLNLVGEEQTNGFQRLLSSVHVVTKE